MDFFLTSTIKDLRRRLADRVALLIWLGIPMALGGMLSLIADDGATPTALVFVADEDATLLSGLIAGSAGGIGAGALGPIELEQVDSREEGRGRIDAGEGSALLVIPAGFSDAIVYGEPAELVLVKNPSQQILPQIAEQAAEMLVEAAFYAHRLLGDELQTIAAGPAAGAFSIPDAAVASIGVSVNQKVENLAEMLFPPVIQLEQDAGEESGGGLGFWTLFLPGLLFMALLFIASGMADDIWEERERGTLRRVLTTPRAPAAFLSAKLAAGTVLVTAVAAVTLGLLVFAFGIPAGRFPLALLWCAFAGTALIAFFFLIQLFAGSRRGANILTTMIVFPLMMIGGSFFPFETMPTWMRAIGRWTPNGQAVVRLKEMLMGDPRTDTVLIATAAIGLPAALALWVAIRRLRGGFALGG